MTEIEDRSDKLLEAAARWTFFHDLLRPPGKEQWAWLREPRVQTAWALLAAEVGLPETLPLPICFEAFEQEYLNAFEVGAPEPLCPLIESHWNKRDPVPRILHENILFYKQFGLELKSTSNETADHLRHQLGFLAYLCRREADALAIPESAATAEQFAAARHDFLTRHTAYWLPLAAARINREAPDSWAACWLSLLSECLNLSE
ncbi:MAG: molecular chaperone TorD family protein [bacterium]